jgi:CBS domain-containing protein
MGQGRVISGFLNGGGTMTHYPVKDWMTPNPITIDWKNNLSVAYHLMRFNQVRRLPVVGDDGKLVGILTWGDIRENRPKEPLAEQRGNAWEEIFLASTVEVRMLMTHNPFTVTPDSSIRLAANLMLEHKISGLPVVENGYVVGMITESDLFRFLLKHFPADGT